MFDKAFPVTGQLNVKCAFRSGSLTMRATDNLAEARVRIDPHSKIPVDDLFRVELIGDRLEVIELSEFGNGGMRGFSERMFGRQGVEIQIDLPSGSPVDVSAGAASITSRGRLGATKLHSGSSEVELDVVDGAFHLRGGSGNLSVNRVAGAGNVRGGSGRMAIGEIGGDLSVSVGSGELSIGTAHGTVRSRSGSGSVVVAVAERDVDIMSSSGPVTVGLRPGQNARLDVATGSGRLVTEMPMQDGPSTGPAITIRARTGSGDVFIRRAVPAAN